MRMTSRKKEILSYFEPDSLEWVIGEIGAPPFDVSGVAYLLHGMVSSGRQLRGKIGCHPLEDSLGFRVSPLRCHEYYSMMDY